MPVFDNDIAGLRLEDFGQPVTLQHRATRRETVGIVSDVVGPVNVLTGEGPMDHHSIEVATTDAAGVDTHWTVSIGCITRPVIWVSPPTAGMVRLILGSEQ